MSVYKSARVRINNKKITTVFFLGFILVTATINAEEKKDEVTLDPKKESSISVDMFSKERQVFPYTFKLEPLSGSQYFHLKVISRSLAELTLQVPAVWNEGFHSLYIKIDNNNENIDSYYESYNREKLSRIYGFILQKGNYRVKVGTKLSRLKKELTDEQLNLEVKIQPKEVAKELVMLNNWLIASELSKYFKVLDIYRIGNNNGLTKTLISKFDHILNKVTNFRANFKVSENSKTDHIPNDLIKTAPTTIIIMRSKIEKELSELEKLFYKNYGIPIWDRIFKKLSFISSIRSKDIVISMLYRNQNNLDLIFEERLGFTSKYSEGYRSISTRRSIDITYEKNLTKASRKKLTSLIDLSQIIPTFLPSFISSPKAKFSYLEKSNNFVEVIIRGLKGEVIQGGNEWEKIQISFIRSSQNSGIKELIVLVDGHLASGIGRSPEDMQFTKSMEPKFSNNLNNYAKKLSTSLISYIKSRIQDK